eukprot:TRINITY_DN13022_c0_g1_i1.p1 TRINITY_DN13022_c0_g1~~TRINITY_DN13022_c0_g1_i1.p1  ORF type:complete len:128 (+),score=23.80 TRINITY_DN13022_c0_g1_i1:86-469(+)
MFTRSIVRQVSKTTTKPHTTVATVKQIQITSQTMLKSHRPYTTQSRRNFSLDIKPRLSSSTSVSQSSSRTRASRPAFTSIIPSTTRSTASPLLISTRPLASSAPGVAAKVYHRTITSSHLGSIQPTH